MPPTGSTRRFARPSPAILLSLFLALEAALPGMAHGLSFLVSGPIPAGDYASAVVTADFNQDGKLDLATADPSSNSMAVLLGKGDGTFTAYVTYPVGNHPDDIVTADFNGDGKLDLATADTWGNSVSILMGKGDGTFEASVSVDIGVATGPSCLAARDFTGDGFIDLAVGDYAGKVTLLRNDGTGTLVKGGSWAVGSYITGIAADDFDRDGDADLATVCGGTNTVAILLGDGAGGFGPGAIYACGNLPVKIIAAPLDGDDLVDLACVDEMGQVVTLRGLGDGGFVPLAPLRVGNQPECAAAADLDGDGYSDLAVGKMGVTAVSLFTPGGPFGPVINLPPEVSASLAEGLAAGDFDRDGQTDLVSASGWVYILLNRSFTPKFLDTFASPTGTAAKWTLAGGSWIVAGGDYVASPGSENITLVRTPGSLPDGRISAWVTLSPVGAGGPNLDLVFGWKNARSYRWVRLKQRQVAVGQTGDMGSDRAGIRAARTFRMLPGRRYRVQVDLYPGPEVRVSINGRRILSTRFFKPVNGAVGLRADRSASRVDKFTILQ